MASLRALTTHSFAALAGVTRRKHLWLNIHNNHVCRLSSVPVPKETPRRSLRYQSYINGEWVSGEDGKTFTVFNPANGEEIGEMCDLTAADTKHAVDAACDAFPTWSKTSAKVRSSLLNNWYNLMIEHTQELAKMLTEENGKPISQARVDVEYAASFLEWYAAEARRVYGETIELPAVDRRSIIMKQPIGVAGIIVPWNFPPSMLTRKVAPALAAGCTVVVKTPEDTPFTPTALAELAHLAGMPKGVINVVSCSRENAASIGQLFCEDPKVATVSFTGSCEVGKLLMAGCASQVKRISLELGGLAPLIVFNSAIISDVVKGTAYAKFRNSGQACVSPQNFYVQEGIYEKVLEALKHLTMSMKLGDGMDADTDLGPLINIKGVEKVEKLVNDAVSKGAKVVVGGKTANDVGKLYFQPTLLANVTDEMDIVHQEVFGPVISMIPFRTEEEVLRRANNTRRGLASYFYSQNLSQCYRMMEGLEAGMVGCNETAISSTETPFGGWKQSGLGREGGKYGMDEFLETKMCSIGLSHP